MKKYNYILIMVMTFAMTLASCSQKEEIGSDIQRTAQVEVNLSKADFLKSGALTNPSGTVDEIVYCDEDLATAGTVTLSYIVEFNDGTILGTVEDPEKVAFEYDSESTVVDEGISELIQFDFPEGATTATITVTKATISDYNDLEDGQDFVAPVVDSPFADYVDNPVGKPWTVDLYGKTYIKVEVLCFNKQAVALFGYSWFDFEIVTGDEVCVFFNCLGVTSETYHQVYAAKVDAYMYTESSYDLEYWSGLNYDNDIYNDDYDKADIRAFCIPMPGNWKTYGVELVLTPLGSSNTTTTISLTPAQIEAFLAETPVAQELIAEDNAEMEYSLDLDIAGNAPFLHYTMKDCQKPMMYYSNNTSGPAGIYGINVSDGVVYPTQIAELEGYKAHLAVTPDETTLIVGNKNNPLELTLIDLYTMEKTVLIGGREKPLNPDTGELMGNEYKFVQLVYIDDQLYAGCESNECLVPINFTENGFEYGYDLIDMNVNDPQEFDLGGGDLLASKASNPEEGVHKGNVIYSFTNNRAEKFIKYYRDADGNVDERRYILDLPAGSTTGAAFNYKADNQTAVTSNTNGGVVEFYLWEKGTGYQLLKYPEGVSISGTGGDMASSWNNTLEEGAMGAIFGFDASLN